MPEPNPRASRNAVILLAILGLTFLVYLPVLDAGFIWDDDAYVTHNVLLRSGEGLGEIWLTTKTPQYYPLVFTSFWVEYHLWGLQPAGYHAVNVLLHGLNALLVALILGRLRVPGALWIALLFAVHPVHVESVAWITERKNVLSALFYLAALLSYLRFDENGRRRHYVGALVLFVAALLSKTVTASLPVVLGMVLLHRHRRWTAADGRRLLPFFVIAAGLSAVTVLVESRIVDPVAADFALTPLQRLLVASKALGFYVWKLVVPHPLIFNYPRWPVESATGVAYWPLLPALAVPAGLVWLWLRGQRGVVLLVVFFGVSLFPALGFIDVYPFRYSFVADHFQYIASLGLLILLVQAGRILARYGSMATIVRLALGLLIVALLGGLTWRQSRIYKDAETLWRDTLAKNPSSWISHNNLGLILLDRGEAEQALTHFDRALEAQPDSAESLTARGMARARLQQPDAALSDFDRALILTPSYPQAVLQRALLRVELGRFDEAIDDLSAMLAANPDTLSALQARGVSYLALDRPDLALADFTRAIELDAGVQARLDRGAAYFRLQRYDDALADFNVAIDRNPGALEAIHNRGMVQARLGRHEQALEDFTRVIAADPAARKSYIARGMIHAEVRHDPQRACEDWARACELGECRPYTSRCE